MTNYKFYLEFLSDGFGKKEISEPIGFASLVWVVKQKDKGHGRDISFNDGESELKFVWTRNHYLDKIFFYDQIYGFESKVLLFVETNGVQTILGDLDFATRKTDNLEYFSCKVIQDSKLLTVNRQKNVKVDVLSPIDLSMDAITPLVPTTILVKAKSVFSKGEWKQETYYDRGLDSKSSYGLVGDANTAWYFVNPCSNITNSGLDGMLTFIDTTQINTANENFPTSCDLKILQATQNLTNINIDIKDAVIQLSTVVGNGGNGYVDFNAYIRFGENFETANEIKIPITAYLTENKSYNGTLNFNYTINKLSRGEFVWVYFQFKVRQSDTNTVLNAFFRCNTIISGMKTTVTAESTTYNSITKAFRLHDVIKQVVRSSSGLDIKATRFGQGGEFYNNFLINGNLLRSIIDKPFLISLEEISKSIVEMNADYEVNDEVFFGIEKDFYMPNEIWFFDKVQFSQMNITYNPEMTINKFTYKSKNYQSLKENEQANSADTIHGEISLLLQNKMVENNKMVEVDWIRDSFLIDEARKKSIEIDNSTSSQNDNDIFALDCIENEVDLDFTEVSELNHEWNIGLNNLILRSDEKLNFKIIGIFEGSHFEIKAPDKNTGIYTVYKVDSQELRLNWVSGGVMTSNNDGVRFTQYTYIIPKEQIPYISRTNEGIVSENIKSPETFANLGYSVKGNVENYYSDYLATCNLYHKEKPITISEYKHNGECIISHNGKTIKENAPFTPINPILSPLMYSNMTFSNLYFDEYLLFIKELRSKRGYFRTIGNDGNPIKAYTKDLQYDALKKELTITAKGKYDPILMTITKDNAFLTINNETRLYLFDAEIKDDKLYVYDANRQLLYKPVFYNMININGATTESINIFKEWVELLKN